MLPYPMSRSEPSVAHFHPQPLPDLTRLLEQHVSAGFPPDLALDLVLNELVVRAADATHASSAALALVRDDEMVYRAATGLHAPDLGVPLNIRGGLSSDCIRFRLPQLSTDTESDPRVDAASFRRLGIRSMLIVPVFDPVLDSPNDALDELHHSGTQGGKGSVSEIRPQLAGVLEVFSSLPNAFPPSSRALLEDFARECARTRLAATHLRPRPPVELIPLVGELSWPDADPVAAVAEPIPFIEEPVRAAAVEEFLPPEEEFISPVRIVDDSPAALVSRRQSYEGWTLVLGALVILAAIAFSFMIGSRVGWLRSQARVASVSSSPVVSAESFPAPTQPRSDAATNNPPSPGVRTPQSKRTPTPSAKSTDATLPDSSSDLVFFEKGKVVFRLKPPHTIWLAPEEAASRLVNRVEPQYPADALAAHRSGNVTLEVHVAEDGSVSSVHALGGDPLLATAAAQAVRNWRYQPYSSHARPSPFQTNVTLTFSLPN